MREAPSPLFLAGPTSASSLTFAPRPRSAHESGGNTRGVEGEKNWQDMSSGDLKRAAEDQHDRPLGTFVGEEGVKEREGDEVRTRHALRRNRR